MYRQIELTDDFRAEISAELDKYHTRIDKTLSAEKTPIDRDLLLRFRSYWQGVLNILDTYWDGNTCSLARHWYRAEDCGFAREELRAYTEILTVLARCGKVRITAAQTAYTVKDVPAAVLDDIRAAMPKLTEMRSRIITHSEYRHIRSIGLLIEYIDTEWNGEIPESMPQGISVAERWAAAGLGCDADFSGASEKAYTESFETMYAILVSILVHGKAKIRKMSGRKGMSCNR